MEPSSLAIQLIHVLTHSEEFFLHLKLLSESEKLCEYYQQEQEECVMVPNFVTDLFSFIFGSKIRKKIEPLLENDCEQGKEKKKYIEFVKTHSVDELDATNSELPEIVFVFVSKEELQAINFCCKRQSFLIFTPNDEIFECAMKLASSNSNVDVFRAQTISSEQLIWINKYLTLKWSLTVTGFLE